MTQNSARGIKGAHFYTLVQFILVEIIHAHEAGTPIYS